MLFVLEQLDGEKLRQIKLDYRNYHDFVEWVSMGGNMTLWFTTMHDSNQPAQLQRLAGMLKVCM